MPAGEPRSWGRAAWAALVASALDAVLPVAAYTWLAARLHPEVVARLDTVVPGGGMLRASDIQGAVWFYWWVHEAFVHGRDLLNPDVLCFPRSVPLGEFFPNRVDAWLALPFLHELGWPRGLNVFVLAIPAFNALAAYAFLRTVTRSRLAALGMGALYGFSAHVFYEVWGGRPVTALIPWAPLFLAPWQLALTVASPRVAVGWAAVAGIAAGIAVWAYFPSALFLALAGGLLALGHAFAPVASRARPLVGLVTLLVSAVVVAPYAHELLVVRQDAEDRAPRPTRAPWEARMWTELADALGEERGGPSGDERSLVRRVQVDSLAVSWPWSGDPRARVPLALLIAFAAAALVPRARGWALLAGVLYVFTLGPHAATAVEGAEIATLDVGGRRLALPARALLRASPRLGGFVRPYRVAPLVLLVMGAAVVAAVEAGRARGKPGILLGPLALGVAALGVRELHHADAFRLDMRPYGVPPFLAGLAEDPDDYAIAELPVGLGHATARFQPVHRKRRAEPHRDLQAVMEGRGRAPSTCYDLPFLQDLWALGGDTVPEDWTVATAEAARAEGLRYVVVYPELFDVYFGREGRARLGRTRSQLFRVLGRPVFEDEVTTVYELPRDQ